MSNCKEKDRYIIQENDRIINFGDKGSVLVTDKCVVIINDSITYNYNSGVNHHSLSTKVYTLQPTPTINNFTTTVSLPTSDTNDIISKFEKKLKEDEEMKANNTRRHFIRRKTSK